MSTIAASVARWSELPADTPMPQVERRRMVGAHAMLSHIRLEAGCVVPTHTHANEQFACVLSGRIRFGLGADGDPARREVTVGAGEVLLVPANMPHSATALEDTIVLDVFSPPSERTGVDG